MDAGYLRQELGDLGERDGRAVNARHAEAPQDDLVERRVRATRQEAVQLCVTVSAHVSKDVRKSS